MEKQSGQDAANLHTSKMVRMGDRDLRRLAELSRRLELTEAAVIRLGLRVLAEREKVE